MSAINPFQPDDVTRTRWHSTFFASLGVEFRADDRWTVRAGTAFDESPVPSSTREPRIPDAGRIWLSAGASYRLSDSTDFKLTLARLFNLHSRVNLSPAQPGNALRGSLSGTTDSYVNVFGLQVTYRTP